MIHSFKPGGKPSVSNRLANYLNGTDNEPMEIVDDEFDALINREQLRISRFVWVRELDLVLLILNDRRVISHSLSAYPLLAGASDEALAQYTVSESGIHWPELDADLSLRGLLMSEMIKGNVAA